MSIHQVVACSAVIFVNSALASLCLIVAVAFWSLGEEHVANGLMLGVVALVLSVIAAFVRYGQVTRRGRN